MPYVEARMRRRTADSLPCVTGVVVPRGSGGVAVPLRSRRGRGILAATVIGSGMTFLDATIASIAAERIGHDFDATFGQLQWVINGYTLTLAALILLGGSLGDRLGRRRVFMVGVAWFALASLGCALAPDVSWLVGLRAIQGVGAALMMPGSLAILQAVLAEEDRGAAVGAWSGLTGVASAAGPLVGGWFVQSYSWRLAFAINVPLAVVTLVLAWRSIPETSGGRDGRPDVLGTVTVAAGLAALTYGTTSAGAGWARGRSP
jgi:MFS family permease